MHQWQRLPTKHQTEGLWFWLALSRKEQKKPTRSFSSFLLHVVAKNFIDFRGTGNSRRGESVIVHLTLMNISKQIGSLRVRNGLGSN